MCIDSLAVTALPQANAVTTTARRQQETTTVPVEQRHITPPTELPVLECHDCYEASGM